MIRKSNLTKRLSMLLLCGAMVAGDVVPAMASSVVPETTAETTDSQQEMEASETDSETGAEVSDEVVKQPSEESTTVSGAEETDVTPVAEKGKEDAADAENEENSPETSETTTEAMPQLTTEIADVLEKTDNETVVTTQESTARLASAKMTLVTGAPSSATILTGSNYSAKNIKCELTYTDGTTVEGKTSLTLWTDMLGQYDDYYHLRLIDQNGNFAYPEEVAEGTYRLILVDEDDKQVASLSGFTLYVKSMQSFQTEKLVIGENTVRTTPFGDADGTYYEFTPSETGKYFIPEDVNEDCFYYEGQSKEEVEIYQSLAELKKGVTYYFRFYNDTDEAGTATITLGQEVKCTGIKVETPKTSSYPAYQTYPCSDWKVTFSYADRADETYMLTELPVLHGNRYSDDLKDAYDNVITYELYDKATGESDNLRWLDQGTYTVKVYDIAHKKIAEQDIQITAPADNTWENVVYGENQMTDAKIQNGGLYYHFACEANTDYVLTVPKWSAGICELKDGRMTDLDSRGVMLGGGMYRYYFNSGNRTDVYVYCEYTKNFDYTMTIEKENECAHKNLKEERTEATCSKEGKITYTCADCGYSYTETLPVNKNRHSNVVTLPAKAATCTEAGKTEGKQCKDCGQILTAQQTIPATGHAYGKWITTMAATVTANGVQTRTCTTCGQKETCALKKLTATGTLNATAFPLKVKQSAVLTVSEMAAGDKVVSWTSSDKKIATVTNKGKVTGKKKGKATITATLASGLKLTAKVTVQTKTVKTSKITVNKKNVTLTKNKSFQLVSTIAPFTSKDKLSYKTSNKKVATVSKNGKITAKKAGSATITVKSGKKSVKVKVTVKK